MTEIIDLSGKKILVVEDDDMNYVYLSQLFKLTSGEIKRVKSGKDALLSTAKMKYDVILMDIQLPDISGNEVTKRIRVTDKTTPIIAQTASKTPDETDLSLEAGCTDVLIKPFSIDDLSLMLKKYI